MFVQIETVTLTLIILLFIAKCYRYETRLLTSRYDTAGVMHCFLREDVKWPDFKVKTN